jgi:hypothetical protein
MPDEKHPTPAERDEPIKIDLDPETTLRELLKVDPEADVVRWHIVSAATGDPAAPPNPPNGFGSEDEALDFHAAVLRGAPQLVVRAAVPDRL